MHPIDLLYKQLEIYEQELSRAHRNMGVYLCPSAKKDLEGLIDRYKKAIKKLE